MIMKHLVDPVTVVTMKRAPDRWEGFDDDDNGRTYR